MSFFVHIISPSSTAQRVFSMVYPILCGWVRPQIKNRRLEEMSVKILRDAININGATYEITSEGKVFGVYGKPISIRPNSDGYASFTAGRKGNRTRERVHRLVAKLFIPNPNNLPEIDHLDGNRMNSSKDNLEWVTHEENVKRAYRKGSYKGRYVGQDNPKARLNENLVIQLRNEYRAGASVKELSNKYGYPWSTIGNAVKGYTWKHLPM